MVKTGALFFFVFGVIATLATFAQINPVWEYGPYSPAIDSANSQPDWYIGFMEGSLRIMPGIVTNVARHTFVWNVFIPAVLLPAGFFILLGLYPVFEEWVTGDLRHHQILDRPRNAPARGVRCRSYRHGRRPAARRQRRRPDEVAESQSF